MMLLKKYFFIALLLGFISTDLYALNSTKINEHIDASGKITVVVFERISGVSQAHFNDFSVELPAQFVAIGGGVEGVRVPQGNLLTASYPNSGLTGWMVSTKDHLYSNPAKIKAWVIGLKIEGLTRQQLMSHISVNVASTGYVPHPDISVGTPEGYVLIGGGFKVNWSGAGNLATASYPETAYTWRAQSKDHSVVSPASTQVYAVGLKEFIPNIGSITVDIASSQSGYVQHPASTSNITSGYALTGCGAKVNWSGAGNLLWKIKPVTLNNQHGCEAASKDHEVVSPATIQTYSVGIMLN